MFSGQIGHFGIAQGHLDLLVAQDLLQYFQTHAGIEHVGGKGVAQVVQAVAFIGETSTFKAFAHGSVGRDIADGPWT